jgi:hypothetical protein
VIDASNVRFDGVRAAMLDQTQRDNAETKIVDFNDDNTLGLIFLPPAVTTPTMLPSPAENPGLIPGLPGKENTPGDTLFVLTGGAEFSPNPGQANAFCFGYSLADPTATGSDEQETCIELTTPSAPVTPNQNLHNFWRGWQAARL